MQKILVSIPTSRYIEPECFASVYEQYIPKGYKTELYIPQNYSIDVSRNQTIEYALENGFAYIMFVDSDIILPKMAIASLLSDNVEIVSGIYAYKILAGKTVVVKKFDDGSSEMYHDLNVSEIVDSETRLIEADGFGFGCVLLNTKIFEKIEPPYFVYRANLGEDIYFCQKAQNAGYTLYADTKILCGHKGDVNYNIKG